MTDFASVGSLGSANEYDFGKHTLELSPSSDVPAGDLVVVFVTWTSHYFFGPDGLQTPECSCTDDAGNLYQQLYSEYMPGPASYLALFVSRLRNDLTTSDTITLKHYGPGAKAASLEQFTLDPDRRFALLIQQIARAGADPGDPPSITISGLDPAREYLLLHVLMGYGPQSDAYTWDSDYTQIVGDGTSSGNLGLGVPPNSDVHVRGGYRIATGLSSDTVDVTSTGTDRRCANALVALVSLELDEDFPDFPNTPILDDFNRANEDPNVGPATPDGSLWDSTSSLGGRPGFGSALTRVVSNTAAMSSSGSGSGSEYLLEQFETDEDAGEMEEYGTLATVGDLVLLYGHGVGSASDFAGSGTGYRDSGLRAQNAAAVPVAATFWAQATFNGDVPGGNASSAIWGVLPAGARIGFQQLTIDLWTQHLFLDVGAGWEWVAALIFASPPPSGFETALNRFAIAFEGDTATRLDDLGGGMLERHIPQIIRRPPDPGGRRIDL